MKKTIFAITDIHGHYTQMVSALKQAGFDKHNPDHLLVCCGDYFDRGRENRKVLVFLEGLKNKVLLRGNHEDMLEKLLHKGKMETHHYLNGTQQTVEEFFGKYALLPDGTVDFSGKNADVNWLLEFIGNLENYFETKHYVFTHGWLPVEPGDTGIAFRQDWRNAGETLWQKARWTKWTQMVQSCHRLPGKTIVCGHMPTFFASQVDENREYQDCSIYLGDGFVALDAGTCDSKQVNVFVAEDELLE